MHTESNATENITAQIGRWTIATVIILLVGVFVEPVLEGFGIRINFGAGLLAAVIGGFAISAWWPGWVRNGLRAALLQVVLAVLIFGGFGAGVLWLVTLGVR